MGFHPPGKLFDDGEIAAIVARGPHRFVGFALRERREDALLPQMIDVREQALQWAPALTQYSRENRRRRYTPARAGMPEILICAIAQHRAEQSLLRLFTQRWLRRRQPALDRPPRLIFRRQPTHVVCYGMFPERGHARLTDRLGRIFLRERGLGHARQGKRQEFPRQGGVIQRTVVARAAQHLRQTMGQCTEQTRIFQQRREIRMREMSGEREQLSSQHAIFTGRGDGSRNPGAQLRFQREIGRLPRDQMQPGGDDGAIFFGDRDAQGCLSRALQPFAPTRRSRFAQSLPGETIDGVPAHR